MIATRLRRGELVEPVPGVLFHPSAPMTFRARLSIATLAGGGSVASHRAAALLHGVDGFESAPLEVTVPRGRYPEVAETVLHRVKSIDRRDITAVDGIRTVSVARMLAEMGAVVDQDLVDRA